MAYDEALAVRIRGLIGERPEISERKMFGGIAFMAGGNMFAGVIRDELMARVGPVAYDEWLSRPGARPMEFTGRPMKGMVSVSGAAIETDAALGAWLEQSYAFATSLPAKEPAKPKTRRRKKAV